jgi:hypothetical protein
MQLLVTTSPQEETLHSYTQFQGWEKWTGLVSCDSDVIVEKQGKMTSVSVSWEVGRSKTDGTREVGWTRRAIAGRNGSRYKYGDIKKLHLFSYLFFILLLLFLLSHLLLLIFRILISTYIFCFPLFILFVHLLFPLHLGGTLLSVLIHTVVSPDCEAIIQG